VARYVGLLRGINVGGKNKLAMSELRTLVESLGCADVTTFIQSGNVVFTTSASITSSSLESAIAKRFGIDITVVLRTLRELKRTVTANPFAGVDPSKVHVGFMAQKPSAAAVKAVDAERFRPEEFAIRGRELYLHLPNGMGRSKLPVYIDRQLRIPTTIRNWATVTKLVELASSCRDEPGVN
jgi:uncharacterized protein (DUF1697 family)